jgi:glucose-1-phosphate thymidylyltransferase
MRAIIPVAGFGSRLKPHTYSIPKVLLNVGGKPILGHIIDKILSEGIYKATFVIGHLGEMIREFVATKYPHLTADFVEQEEMQGLGHAIYKAIPTFDEKEIFIILGDTIFDVKLSGVFSNKVTSLGVKTVEDPSRFGVAVLEGENIKQLVEKPKVLVSKLALVGLYYISESALLTKYLTELVDKDIRTNGELQLTDALQLMIEAGEKITTFPVDGWYDCGKPETLLSTNQVILDRTGTKRNYTNVVINDPVYIDETAEISESVIGPHTTISAGAVVLNSIIKNSIIGKEAKISNSMLENSIIGNHAIVAGHFRKINTGDSSELDIF